MSTVYQSKFYTLYQSDVNRCFYIDFGQKIVKLSFCQLLALRQKVNSIALEAHFDADLNKHGFEIVMLCNKEHLFLLNTLEVIDLKQLVYHGFARLGISSENVMAVS